MLPPHRKRALFIKQLSHAHLYMERQPSSPPIKRALLHLSIKKNRANSAAQASMALTFLVVQSLPPAKNAPGSLRRQNNAAGNLPPGRNAVPNHLHLHPPPFQRRPP
jgi:hypothetical protein